MDGGIEHVGLPASNDYRQYLHVVQKRRRPDITPSSSTEIHDRVRGLTHTVRKLPSCVHENSVIRVVATPFSFTSSE